MMVCVKMSKRVGRPSGIPRESGWGSGIKTKPVRVPIALAGKLRAELDALEAVRMLVADWEVIISDAESASSYGEPSPRYEKALVLLAELRSIVG
jgi:hypothetical protein